VHSGLLDMFTLLCGQITIRDVSRASFPKKSRGTRRRSGAHLGLGGGGQFQTQFFFDTQQKRQKYGDREAQTDTRLCSKRV